MKVSVQQEVPHPVFEIVEPVSIQELAEWLDSEDLPADMTICVAGSLIRFRTRIDRDYYIMGLLTAQEKD